MKTRPLLETGKHFLTRVARALEHHPRHVTALVAAVLLGGGGGAFAVASFGPDPADMPVRQVLESVEPLALQPQLEALDLHALKLYRSDVVRATDTVESLLARLGVADAAAAAFLRADEGFRNHVIGAAGRSVTAQANERHGLEQLSTRWVANEPGQFQRLVIERGPQGSLTSRIETAPLQATTRLGGGIVQSSLFASMDESRIPDEIAAQVADILGSRIDFHRDLRRGDRFSIVYESLEADGEPMRTGRVLSVEFINDGKPYTAMWFQEPGRKGAYFTLEGKSMQSAYLASPVAFSRVTSGFRMRFHPILQQWRAHLGTDYGAPTGTAVRTVGDGVVEFAGWQNGFGNVVIVRHNASDTTVYAHLSRIDVRRGQAVAQGDRIAAVGATGWATGPHLHFEFRVNGQHRDPLQIARMAEGAQLSAPARAEFDRVAQGMRLKLTAAAQATGSQVASID